MVKHVLSDGTILSDVRGHVVKVSETVIVSTLTHPRIPPSTPKW